MDENIATGAPALGGALASAADALQKVKSEIKKAVIGQDAALDGMLVTLLCGGHAIFEGVPGTAKTLMVRALAAATSLDTKRIQFTPDLMPSDITGTNVFNLASNSFDLVKGPVFTSLLLADEINRAPAKTQSALLEGMNERQVTIDGKRHALSSYFTVFATQNPIEFEGTYPLPEAQLDRFLMKIRIDYPDLAAERAVMEAVGAGKPPDRLENSGIIPVMGPEDLDAIRAALPQVRVEPEIVEYILKVVRATRDHESILVGAGPRGSIFLLVAAKANALIKGRDFATPDDVVAMVNPVLGHRITLSTDAEIRGGSTEEAMAAILDKTEVPR
ncbi:MAG: MoxR family ATPase [Nitrospinota bacterium]|nr:MoxR family ATPase [Nitrospinota bacterium]